MAVPTTDAPLAQWSTTFQSVGSADAPEFGLTVPQMTQYTTLHNSYMSAYNACKADGSRTRALVVAKNDAKASLLAYARELYAVVQAAPTVSNENKTLIGVTVRDVEPTPVPPPALAPQLTVVSVVSRTVRYRLADAESPNRRRRPANAAGAIILTYAGPTPPPPGDPGWVVQGQTGQTTAVVEFGNDVAPGTACWAVAMWYSRRGLYSPACQPVQTYLQVGPVQQAA